MAKLMLDVGIAFHMGYGTNGSVTNTIEGVTAFPKYFRYKSTIHAVYRTDYANDSEWMQVFKSEVANNRPCHVRINDPQKGSHSVVVDGYRDLPSEQFHVNVGWSGSYDGWYFANNIAGGGYTWSDVNGQYAVIGIEPDTSPNQAPQVFAGADLTVTLPAVAELTAGVIDDVLPNPPGALTISWSKVSGPGTVTFADPSNPVTTAAFSSPGVYLLRLSADDSVLSGSDDIAVTVLAATPCAGLCANPVKFSIAPYGSYQSGNLGTGAVCRETTSTIHGGNCSNFRSPRTLQVNGTTKTCNSQNWSTVPAQRNGGYCIQTAPGDYPWAAFALW